MRTRRFFRGKGDVIALACVGLTVATMLCAVSYYTGRVHEQIAQERKCADRFECLARDRGYQMVRTGR